MLSDHGGKNILSLNLIHYLNIPMQYAIYCNSNGCKIASFQMKNCEFLIFAKIHPIEAVLNICNEYPIYVMSKNKIKNVYPCKPQLYHGV